MTLWSSSAWRRSWLFALGLALAVGGIAPRRAMAQGRAGGVTEEEEAFEQAETAFKENRDDDALKLYEKVTTLNPTRAEAWVKRAVILYKKSNYEEAKNVLVKARGLLPDEPSLTGQLGMTLYRMGKTDAAVALLEEAVGKLPDAFQFQLQLGQHYVRAGDGKRAVAALENYFRTRPEAAAGSDARVKSLSGRAYLMTGQYAEAQRDLEIALKADPRDAAARAALGAVYAQKGDWLRCIAAYGRVLDQAQRDPSVSLNLGTCEHHLNQRAEAEKNALAYTKARPQDARGWLLLGDVRASRHDFGKALESYEAAKAAEPQNQAVAATVAAKEGAVDFSLKQYPKAKEAFEDAIKARPDDAEVLVGLGKSYVATQQSKEKLLDVAEKLSKLADPQAVVVSATAFYAAGDDTRALKQFEAASAADAKAFEPRRGTVMALNRLAGAAVQKNDLAGAAEMLQRAEKLMPDSVITARNLGLVLLLQAHYADAEAVLKKAHERVGGDMVVNRLIGRALVGEKKSEEAIGFYEKAVQAGQKVHGPQLAEVLTEVGPLYVDAGRFDLAVLALETAVKEAGAAPIATAAQRNLAIAYLRRGIDRLDEAQKAQESLDDIGRAASARGVLTGKETAALQCALALATLKAGKPGVAMDSFARAQKEGGCSFKAPFDKVGQEFFSAYASYRTADPARREAAAKSFGKLVPRVAGALAEQLRELERSSYELEAVDLYGKGDKKKASASLKSAARISTRSEHRELDNNLGVVDLDEGRDGSAEKTFEGLGLKPPEALVNLGIIKDRQGESKKALDLYKKALDRGARAPHLREWIDVKERVFSRAVTGGGK